MAITKTFEHTKGCLWATKLPTGVGYWGCTCGLDDLLLQLEGYETERSNG
jgi:hypothetical protein